MSLARSTAILLSLLAISHPVARADSPSNITSVLLTANRRVGFVQRVTVDMTVQGILRFQGADQNVSSVPMSVTAKLVYAEKLIELPQVGSNRLRTIRFYQQAEAEIEVDGKRTRSSLIADRKLIGFQDLDHTSALFSPLGPLTRNQLELIDVPCNSAVLDRLLPSQEVGVGKSWNHEHRLLALLLGFDMIGESDVRSRLAFADRNMALVRISGSASGDVGGVVTEMEVQGDFRFDRANRRINSVKMQIKDRREIGHAAPGLDVVAQIEVSIEPAESIHQLNDASLAQLPMQAKDGQLLLSFKSERADFGLLLDRRWHVLLDQHDLTVLRLVDGDRLIAQCNLSKLPDRANGKQRSLENFQQDIQRALEKVFSNFLEAEKYRTDSDLEVLRIVAQGKVSNVPVQWIYCHVTDQTGRRLAYVFTLDAKKVESFGQSDRALTANVRFTPATESAAVESKPDVGPADNEPAGEDTAATDHAEDDGPDDTAGSVRSSAAETATADASTRSTEPDPRRRK